MEPRGSCAVQVITFLGSLLSNCFLIPGVPVPNPRPSQQLFPFCVSTQGSQDFRSLRASPTLPQEHLDCFPWNCNLLMFYLQKKRFLKVIAYTFL